MRRPRAPQRRGSTSATWLGRVRQRARNQRGVAILEAAFITPVFFLLVFGVIEGGMFMQDYLAVSNSVRAGARTASAGGAIAESDLYTLFQIRQESAALDGDQIEYVVIYRATGFGESPTDDGGGPNGGCLSGVSVANVCNVYKPVDIQRAMDQVEEESAQEAAIAAGIPRSLNQSKIWFGCLTTGPHAGASPDRFWCPSARKDTRSDNDRKGPDYVGVYMKAKHPWVTKMFGNTATVEDQSVIQIEPRSE